MGMAIVTRFYLSRLVNRNFMHKFFQISFSADGKGALSNGSYSLMWYVGDSNLSLYEVYPP